MISLIVLFSLVSFVSSACLESENQICLHDRFEVSATWESGVPNNPFVLTDKAEGKAKLLYRTPSAALYTFGEKRSIDLAVQVLDAKKSNGHYWTTYTSPTNFGVNAIVTDTNPLARMKERSKSSDTWSKPLGADPAVYHSQLSFEVDYMRSKREDFEYNKNVVEYNKGRRDCATFKRMNNIPLELEADSKEVEYLKDNRFEVSIEWKDMFHQKREGYVKKITDTSAIFYFEDSTCVDAIFNLIEDPDQVMIWASHSSMSNVDYKINVRDTLSKKHKIYENNRKEWLCEIDYSAFICSATMDQCGVPGGDNSTCCTDLRGVNNYWWNWLLIDVATDDVITHLKVLKELIEELEEKYSETEYAQLPPNHIIDFGAISRAEYEWMSATEGEGAALAVLQKEAESMIDDFLCTIPYYDHHHEFYTHVQVDRPAELMA